MLKIGRAAVFRHKPFTIILKDRVGGSVQPVSVKIDQGAATTGIALVADFERGKRCVWGANLTHKGFLIKDSLKGRREIRRGRRTRKLRYRPARFMNRRRKFNKLGEGNKWLPPSLRSRIDNISHWARRLKKLAPITGLALENVKFDTQKMENPEISGVEYQQGTLAGYEIREYLLEKWGRKCAYCGAKNVPLQIEHITPKSRGGSNRVDNLTISCGPCNQKKNNQTAGEFGYQNIQKTAKRSMRDTAAINAMRWELYYALLEIGLPVELGSGGRTKYNRTIQNYEKDHWIDAACIGQSGESVYIARDHSPLIIKAVGRGNRQMCSTDKYGFPKQYRSNQKRNFGFQTGDIVRANVLRGKYFGVHIGRITIRAKPSFWFASGRFNVHKKYLILLQRCDGYKYD